MSLIKKIEMETTEELEGDSLKRYQKIIDLLINNFHYELINTYKDNSGIYHWKFKNFSEEEINLTENDIESHNPPTTEEKWEKLNEYIKKTITPEVLSELVKKQNLK